MNIYEEQKKWENLVESMDINESYDDDDEEDDDEEDDEEDDEDDEDEICQTEEEVMGSIPVKSENYELHIESESDEIEGLKAWMKKQEKKGLTCYNIGYHDDHSEYNIVAFNKKFEDKVIEDYRFNEYAFEEISSDEVY